jgi:hypothetical protein
VLVLSILQRNFKLLLSLQHVGLVFFADLLLRFFPRVAVLPRLLDRGVGFAVELGELFNRSFGFFKLQP